MEVHSHSQRPRAPVPPPSAPAWVPGTLLGRALQTWQTIYPNSRITAQMDLGWHQPPPDDTRGCAGLHVATGHRCHMCLVACGHWQDQVMEGWWWRRNFAIRYFLPKKQTKNSHIICQRACFVSVVVSGTTFILSCRFNEQETNFQAGYAKLCHPPVTAWVSFSKEMLSLLPKHPARSHSAQCYRNSPQERQGEAQALKN